MTDIDFSKKLILWYRHNKRALPWRDTKDPYKIWISEIMLQQTTVSTVIPYYLRWIKKFPTVQSVAKAPEQAILRLWQGLGYYSRVKNIKKTAELVCKTFEGKIPDEYEKLRKLPGFGPYTTGAVLSIAFEKRFPIVDANVRRVIMRILALKGYADTHKDKNIYSFLDKVLPYNNLSDFNQGLMELGALICKSKNPQCILCPLKSGCKAYKQGTQEIIPQLKEKIIHNVDAVIAIIAKKDKYLIQKRPAKGLLADLWEFPGGKVEKGENIREALDREISEELQTKIVNAEHFLNATHFYTQFRVKLHVFKCQTETCPEETPTRKWVTLKQIQQYPFPSGSVKIIEKLIKNTDHKNGIS
ncbi:MAG: A/G-specific adenine glycosylase [Candidatus Omnitrophica bacterium]|nr:A/G-specific adenine glycosylase [Candidatus Omnitrophota bacterium]